MYLGEPRQGTWLQSFRRARLFVKITAVTVTVAFLGLYFLPAAMAARLPQEKAPATRIISNDEKLAQHIAAIDKFLEKQETQLETRARATKSVVADTTAKDKNELKELRKDLDTLDKQVIEDFQKTEKRLKDKKFSNVILDRHAKAVAAYKSEMALLKANLSDIEKAKDDQAHGVRVKKAKDDLRGKQRERIYTPFDPNKLPYRATDATKTRKPAESKKDFQKLGLVNEERIQVAASTLNPSLISATPATVLSPADLAETIEIRFSEQINGLAGSLGNDPVKMYEHVKNNIVFEPYYGSLKGAHETLAQGAGNDFDLASLLIALLRTSGIPARYVVGTIDVPIDDAMSWLGVANPTVAADIFVTGGVPSTALVSGGKIVGLRLEHVWVEAFVSFENYRGHALRGGKEWIPLDPSFKRLKYTPGPDLKSMAQLDLNAFRVAAEATATIDRNVPSITGMSNSVVEQQVASLRQRLESAVNASIPNAKPQDLIDNIDILKESINLLPASLPYKVVVVGSKYSQVPDGVRYRLRFQVQGDFTISTNGFTYETTMTELAGKKVTLAYDPATAADAATLQAYSGLSNVPAYLVEMKPILLIDGVVRAGGTSGKGLGENQILTTTFILPGSLGTDQVTTNLIVGSYYAVGLSLQKISSVQLEHQVGRFAALQSAISSSSQSILRDDVLGDVLHATAINYFYNLGASDDLISRLRGLVLVRQPSTAITFVDTKVTRVFDVPRTVQPTGFSIDAKRNVVSPFSRSGNVTTANAFLLQSGLASSELEYVILERMFNVHSISMTRVFNLANANGIPIVTINQANIAQVLPLLHVEAPVKAEIRAAVNAGKFAVLPTDNVVLNGWQGSGYLLLDPVTFSGAYRIYGGINGGSTTGDGAGPPPFVGGCAVSSPWSALMDEVDNLLRLASGALGGINLSSYAASICYHLAAMGTASPADVNKAENILKRFFLDAALVIATSILAEGATAIAGVIERNLAVGPVGELLDETYIFIAQMVIELAATKAAEHHLGTHVTTYGGYFILHYLYEYVVLFRAGLLSAFPDDQW